MIKPSCKKIREWIKDETKGSAEYKKYGLPKLSKDESGHKKFLEDKFKKECS